MTNSIISKVRTCVAVLSTILLAVSLTSVASLPAQAKESIVGGGSSFAATILQSCAASYTADTINYSSVGSGTGRTNFLNGTYDFGASDVAYGSADKQPNNFTYVPLVGGPIGILFNVDGIKNLNLSARVLGGIFNGRITQWNDVEIVKLNPKAALPSSKINVVYRSGSSGTTQNLARFLQGNGATGYKDSGSWATASSQAVPVGLSAANAQVLVSELAKTNNSIGYADLADAISKGLEFASIRNPLGEFVKPSVSSASKFLSVQKVLSNGILDIDYKKQVKGGYNASLVTYALAPTDKGGAKGLAIKKFLTYVVNSCAPAKASKLYYTPVSGALKAKALTLIATIK
jgi:phosphate transport system substrate-binding protein